MCKYKNFLTKFSIKIILPPRLRCGKNNSDSGVHIYPNPTIHKITIDLKALPAKSHNISIYSILGQKIRTFYTRKNKISVDLSKLSEGIYLFVITDKLGRQHTQEVIKKAPQPELFMKKGCVYLSSIPHPWPLKEKTLLPNHKRLADLSTTLTPWVSKARRDS